MTPERRRIGFVPQEGSLFPHLSVQQNVGFGLPRGERRGKRVAELLDMVGLNGLERRYPHQLSGGQQQRVALARALAIQPSLVLLDEPFASLDATLRATLRQDVRRVLKEAGTTALMVTHDQDEALSLADRVAIIHQGRVGQCDTPQSIYAHPLSPELVLGLGETNFLLGTARGGAVETSLGLLPVESHAGMAATTPEGHKLLVLVRPEQIVISSVRGEDGRTAVVLASEFYGHDTVIRLRPDWDGSKTIVARSAEADLPEVGALVVLSVRGRVVAWPESAPALRPEDGEGSGSES